MSRFHFDPETGSWSLDAAFEEESRALLSTAKLEQATDEKCVYHTLMHYSIFNFLLNSVLLLSFLYYRSMNSEQLEEHMMVLAIQAAHLASSGLIKNPRFKISAHMFLLGLFFIAFFYQLFLKKINYIYIIPVDISVTGAHFITCSMQTGLIAILPVWFTTSISAGIHDDTYFKYWCFF
jgi:uncharacterized membrane protein